MFCCASTWATHAHCVSRCRLPGIKRTSRKGPRTSASDPKRTFAESRLPRKLRQLGDVKYEVMGACAGFAFAIIIVFLAARLSETLIPGTFITDHAGGDSWIGFLYAFALVRSVSFAIATNVYVWHLAVMPVALRDVCSLE